MLRAEQRTRGAGGRCTSVTKRLAAISKVLRLECARSLMVTREGEVVWGRGLILESIRKESEKKKLSAAYEGAKIYHSTSSQHVSRSSVSRHHSCVLAHALNTTCCESGTQRSSCHESGDCGLLGLSLFGRGCKDEVHGSR